MDFNNTEFRRRLLIQHYESPENKTNKKKIPKNYKSGHYGSSSCIDNINVFTNLENNNVTDAKFDGIACVISTASTDLICNLIKGKTIKQIEKIAKNYINMLDGKKYNAKIIGDLIVFDGVNKQQNRINCAKSGMIALCDSLKININD
ncbi:hypothetical protein FACS189459_6220 [Bacilli bacterium]|nr:hypothetical protein FACS189459_6220 [Bacilli bacterium]